MLCINFKPIEIDWFKNGGDKPPLPIRYPYLACGQLILNAIVKETNVRGVKMSEKNPFEIVDGQVILHDEFQGIDKTILNYEQVAAIKLLIEKSQKN